MLTVNRDLEGYDMSKLIVDQKTIKDLFQDKRADFLIPDYQRNYESIPEVPEG